MKIFAYLLLSILLSACSEEEVRPLRIAIHLGWQANGIIIIAQEKGFLAQFGVEVSLIPTTTYHESIRIFKHGDVDGVFTVLSDVVTLNAESIPTSMIYAIDRSETADLIVGQPELNSLSDLKGKTISFEGFNSFSHLFVEKSMEKAGFREGQYNTRNVPSAQVVEMLTARKIDAGHTWGGHMIAQAAAKGYKVLGRASDIDNFIIDGFSFHRRMITHHPKQVQKLINALVKAVEFIKTSPTESHEIIAKYFKLTPAEVADNFAGLHLFTLEENRQLLKLNSHLFYVTQEVVEFLHKKGGLFKVPSVNGMLDDQFVNPDKSTR